MKEDKNYFTQPKPEQKASKKNIIRKISPFAKKKKVTVHKLGQKAIKGIQKQVNNYFKQIKIKEAPLLSEFSPEKTLIKPNVDVPSLTELSMR